MLRAKLLIFSDDIKIRTRIKYVNDCELLQDDLNRLVLRRETVNLKLNIAKCQVTPLTRFSNLFYFDYNAHGLSVKHSGISIRDLG